MGSSTSRSNTWSAEWRRLCATLVIAAAPAVATAQDAPNSGIADAVLRLAGTAAGNTLPVGGRLYSGTVERSLIVDPDGGIPDFTGNDFVRFLIRRDDLVLDCGEVTRAGLEACIRQPDNTRRLLDILFPGSLSSSLTGRDQAQLFAHQFLQTTAFGMTAVSENGKARRTEVSGLIEREWFTSAAGYHGQAWQGLYQFTGAALSVSGRYATQDDVLRTRSTTVMADYHPSMTIDERGDWRVGLTARTGVSYAHSTDLDLGSIDVGAGGWTSVQHDFDRLRVGGAVLFQGTKSYIPNAIVGEDMSFIADAVNERGIAYDATYGGLVGFVIGPATTLNAKALETRTVAGPEGLAPSRMIMASVSHLFGGVTPIDIGYKLATGGGFRAQSFFVQGNFTW
jgi:hypothetical protein